MNYFFCILQDGFFAAIAAIGFASISNPPRRAYAYAALTAAVGHATRYVLTHNDLLALHLIAASFIAAFMIGTLAVLLAPHARCPAESFSYPALLPMIPGMYAYRTVEALVLALYHTDREGFARYHYLFASNGLTCTFIVLALVVGVTVPIFLLKRISFHATR